MGQLFAGEILWRGGNFPRTIFLGGIFPGGNFPREHLCSGDIVLSAIILGERQSAMGQLSKGNYPAGLFFLGGNCPRTVSKDVKVKQSEAFEEEKFLSWLFFFFLFAWH